METVTPLARALRLKINNRFANDDYGSVVRHLYSSSAYSGRTILICWHHGRIPAFAKALGVPSPPSPWPDTQFDRVWKIEYLDKSLRFSDVPQQLLPGDSQ